MRSELFDLYSFWSQCNHGQLSSVVLTQSFSSMQVYGEITYKLSLMWFWLIRSTGAEPLQKTLFGKNQFRILYLILLWKQGWHAIDAAQPVHSSFYKQITRCALTLIYVLNQSLNSFVCEEMWDLKAMPGSHHSNLSRQSRSARHQYKVEASYWIETWSIERDVPDVSIMALEHPW